VVGWYSVAYSVVNVQGFVLWGVGDGSKWGLTLTVQPGT